MSYVAQRAVLDSRVRVRDLGAAAPSLVMTSVLAGLAVVVLLRWWQQGAALPASWLLPPVETLFLLPGAPVVGLVALRTVVGGRTRSMAGQHLMTMASRWAVLWAVTTAVWLLRTVSDLYGGGLSGLAAADDLVAVVSSSQPAVAQVTLLWVALLVALFGSRLGGWRESAGLLALSAAVVLAAVPTAGVGDARDTASNPAVLLVAALQLVAVAVWLGALVALPHLHTPAYQLRYHLTRFGDLLSASALVVGAAATVAGLLRPEQATPLPLAVAQLAAVGLLATVGHRHRRRTLEVVAAGRGLLLVGLVVGEVVVMGAVVMVGFLPPIAG